MAFAKSSEPVMQALVPLSAVTHVDRDRVGSKAANLAALAHAGFPVPDGFVLTTVAFERFLSSTGLGGDTDPAAVAAAPLPTEVAEALRAALAVLGDGPLAVRSSAIAEDRAEASFAGQYETILDVHGYAALEAAVRRCWASAFSPRVAAYRSWQAPDPEGAQVSPMAVLVQRLVPAAAAGVAFTANPVTGDRHEIIVNAVRGLGERLVSGEVAADEWVVRESEATCRQSSEGILSAEQALAVAELAQRIAAHFGGPQDVEWALAGGQLLVLQARPMTALPEPVAWQAPLPGGWMRNFRLGEWLPEPVTPLFENWLLTYIEDRFGHENERVAGFLPPPPQHIVVNGWYFYSPLGTGSPILLLKGFLRRPRFGLAAILSQSRPDLSDRIFSARLAREWSEKVLPRYQSLVAAWQRRVEEASPLELIRLVDQIADVAGEYLWSISMVGGFAWKVEGALARFYRKHLFERVQRSHQELLCGLPTPMAGPPPHAVQSLDWFRPTLSELAPLAADPSDLAARRARLAAARRAAEAACCDVLAGSPKRLKRFRQLLTVAQRYAVLREEQVAWFTLGWPLMRRAVLRMGNELHQRGVITQAEDVFFLTRAELEAGLGARMPTLGMPVVGNRRRTWERHARLSPPLTLGKLPAFIETMLADTVEAMRMPSTIVPEVLRGMPASPGRALGPVCVIRTTDDFARFRPGAVLVAPVTTPAWTPLFAHAAAVVTDSGSVAAHASLIAREYGIPAVVATGDATVRLRDGQLVTVDGSAGFVEVQ
jgi:phosphohistidine swiveling domain-containing protein